MSHSVFLSFHLSIIYLFISVAPAWATKAEWCSGAFWLPRAVGPGWHHNITFLINGGGFLYFNDVAFFLTNTLASYLVILFSIYQSYPVPIWLQICCFLRHHAKYNFSQDSSNTESWVFNGYWPMALLTTVKCSLASNLKIVYADLTRKVCSRQTVLLIGKI